MISRRLRSSYRLPFLLLSGIVLAFLASGCMWGVVRDADTGKPLSGVRITVTDTTGQTLTTTSDANGLFGFGAPVSASPARGPVNFQVDTPGYPTISETRDVLYDGYPTVSETRDVLYDDNPNATFENMQSFWDVQVFNLAKPGELYHSAQGGFSILLPPDWEKWENYHGPGSVTTVPRADYPIFPADISVGAVSRPPHESIYAWVHITETKVEDVVENLQVLEEEPTTLGGVDAIRIVIVYNVTPDSEVPGLYVTGQQLKELTYFLKKGNEAYIVDFTATAANFPAMRGRYEQFAQSFKLD